MELQVCLSVVLVAVIQASSVGDQDTQMESKCPYPCQCSNMEQNRCKVGVTLIRDGCDCCYICARQQGDSCDIRDKCDGAKGLYCDMKLDIWEDGSMHGICRAKAAKMCEVEGKKYKDGEEFKTNCSRLCTCQNGQYACSSLCPQEERMPSSVHCKDPQLVSIEGRCCREWACPHSHSMPPQEIDGGLAGPVPPKRRDCEIHESDWNPCSVTCGMGVSIRQSNNNTDCKPVNQQRLCLIRPCELRDDHHDGARCKTIRRQSHPIRLQHNGCSSVKDYRPKYCSTCKRERCCRPELTKTNLVEFRCPDGTIVEENVMWVKSCVCDENC